MNKPKKRVVVRALVAVLAPAGLLLFGLTAAGALYEPNTAIPDGFAGRHVSVNGVLLRVLQKGSGPDVLLIHGSPGSVEDWQPVMDVLAGSFRLTAFDRPGHGFSEDTGEYSLESNAEVALELIAALKLENVVVVGHSYGGATALALAVHNPASVGAYVIVDSAAYIPSREAAAIYRLLAAPWLGTGLARVLAPMSADRRIESGIAELSGGRRPGRAFVELRARIWSSPKVTHALAQEILGSRENLLRLSPNYPKIRRPTYILTPAENGFRTANGKRLQRDVAGSVLRLVSGTGHYIQFDQPSAVVDAIRQAALSAAGTALRR